MKYELRGQDLYKIEETKVDNFDVDREIAILEKTISEAQEKLKVFKSFKIKKDDLEKVVPGEAIQQK